MGILDILFGGGQQSNSQFDPFNENEFADQPNLVNDDGFTFDPAAAGAGTDLFSPGSQTPQAPAGGLIGGGSTPRPMSFGPAPPVSSAPNAFESTFNLDTGNGAGGFIDSFFNPRANARRRTDEDRFRRAQSVRDATQHRAAIKRAAARKVFEPGGPLADIPEAQQEFMVRNPQSITQELARRGGKNKAITPFEQKSLDVGSDKITEDTRRHSERVKALMDPNGPFKSLDQTTKQGLSGSPDVLKKFFEEQVLGPGKLERALALKPARRFESTIERKRDERAAVREEAIFTAGTVADETGRSLDAMEGLLAGTEQGFFAPTKVEASQVLKGLGIDPSIIPFLGLPPDVSSAEALKAVTSKQRLVVLSAFKGNQTERELAFTQRVLPQLSNTPAGNKLTLQVLRRQNILDIKMRDALEDHIIQGKGAAEFGKVRRRIQRENKVWTPELLQSIKAAKVGGPSMTKDEVAAITQQRNNAKKESKQRRTGVPQKLNFNPTAGRIE